MSADETIPVVCMFLVRASLSYEVIDVILGTLTIPFNCESARSYISYQLTSKE